MIPKIDTYVKASARPADDIDPKLKALPEYGYAYCKYIYAQYYMGQSGIHPSEIVNIQRNRTYAMGRQDPDIYRKKFTRQSGQTDQPAVAVNEEDRLTGKKEAREGWVDMNFDDIFSPLPKYIMNLIGIFEDQEHDIKIECEDENSGALREEMKYDLLARKEASDIFALVNASFGLPEEQEQLPLPKSLQEFDMYVGMGAFKLPWEIAMKKILNHTEHLSKQPKIKRRVIEDLLCGNLAATMSYIDPGTGKVFNDRVDVADLIVEKSNEEDYSDTTYWGVIRWWSVTDVRSQTGWDESYLLSLAGQVKGLYGNPMNFTDHLLQDGSYDYDSFRLPVLLAWWKTVDDEYRTQRKNSDGEIVDVYEPYRRSAAGKPIPPKVYDKEDRKTYKTSLHTLYHAKWIIGCDGPKDEPLVWDYGKAFNIPYNYITKEIEPPVHIYRIPGKPIIESMIPIEDQIMFSWLRLQNAIIKSPPPGLKIEFGSLENMEFDGISLTPIDIIEIYSGTGNIFYRLSPSMPGAPGQQYNNPIEELKGGVGTAIQDAIQALELFYRQLDVISGIDPFTSVTQKPEPRQGKAVTEIAVAATSNTLKTIYAGYLNLKVAQAKCNILQVQSLSFAYEPQDNPYNGVVGTQHLNAMKAAEDKAPIKYGFKPVPAPNQDMKNEVRNAAQAASVGTNGQRPIITFSEYLFLVEQLDTDDGLKYARLYISYRENQRKQEEMMMAQQAQQAQAQNALAIEQAKQKTIMTEIQMKSKAKIDEINAQKIADLEIEKEKGRIAERIERIRAEAAKMQPEGVTAR